MDHNFHLLAPFIRQVAQRFDIRSRAKLAGKIGIILRNANQKRIGSNLEPDGSAMEPRKRRGRIKKKLAKKGNMFRRMKLRKAMKIESSADHVLVRFDGRIENVAQVHHYGLRDRVGRFKGAPAVKYPQRRLLGIGPEDKSAIVDEILKALEA